VPLSIHIERPQFCLPAQLHRVGGEGHDYLGKGHSRQEA